MTHILSPETSWWHSVLATAALLIGTFFAANCLAGFAQRRRILRIENKAEVLCRGPARRSKSVPITLLTGFLGSGKTTLLNRLLKEPEGRKILVIENELGAVSIDHALLQEEQPDTDVIVLKNGCMCCSGGTEGDLERILDRLVEMRDAGAALSAGKAGITPGRRGEVLFDTVVIECSGLADPAPIIQVLHRHEMKSSGFHLDDVVAMVDAVNIQRHLAPTTSFPSFSAARSVEAEAQIAFADVIVVNKVDVASSSELETVKSLVGTINPSSKVLQASYGQLPLEDVMDLGACDPKRMSTLMTVLDSTPTPAKGRHSTGVRAIVLEVLGELDQKLFGSWVRSVLDAQGETLYRTKGMLAMHEESRRVVVHGVHYDLQAGFGAEWSASDAKKSVLVMIGMDMRRQKARLLAGMKTCRHGDPNPHSAREKSD